MCEYVETNLSPLEFGKGLVELISLTGKRFCPTCHGGGEVSNDQDGSECCGECHGEGFLPMLTP